MTRKTTPEASPDGLYRVYLFTGEVDARRSTAIDALIAKAVSPDDAAFDLEKLDGGEVTAERVLTAVSTLPFGSGRKVVVVDRVDKMSPTDQESLAGFLPKIGNHACLILIGSESASTKKKEASDDGSGKKKGVSLTTAVKAVGGVETFAKMKSQDVQTAVANLVRAHGKKIEPVALQSLARLCDAHPAMIDTEVEKLVAYSEGRDSITLKDVETVSTVSVEEKVFPLINAVAAGRPEAAVSLLEDAFAASSRPDNEVLKVVSLMAGHFRMLYQTKFLLTQGQRGLHGVPEELLAMLMQGKNPTTLGDWQGRKLLDQARAFSLMEIQQCLKHLLKCELAIKGQSKNAGGSPRMNLELLILRLSQRRSIPL
jgi:DNA polymerase-3 subunit delta